MQKTRSGKSKRAMIVIASVAGAVSLSGCGPREDTPTQVVKKTTIEKAPEKKPKTIVVQPAPGPAPKTETETNAKVEVQPSPPSSPAKTSPEPAPVRDSKQTSPSSTPAAKSPKSKSKSKPKASSSPSASPAANPVAKKPDVAKTASSQNLKVRAEVIATSKMPDPKAVPYKDALVLTKYKVLEVENGKYNQKEILVAQWAMKDKKLQPDARHKVGEVQTLSLEPLSRRPELESVMRSDDTGEYDLEPYFAE
jgi:hypothetical protein